MTKLTDKQIHENKSISQPSKAGLWNEISLKVYNELHGKAENKKVAKAVKAAADSGEYRRNDPKKRRV